MRAFFLFLYFICYCCCGCYTKNPSENKRNETAVFKANRNSFSILWHCFFLSLLHMHWLSQNRVQFHLNRNETNSMLFSIHKITNYGEKNGKKYFMLFFVSHEYFFVCFFGLHKNVHDTKVNYSEKTMRDQEKIASRFIYFWRRITNSKWFWYANVLIYTVCFASVQTALHRQRKGK